MRRNQHLFLLVILLVVIMPISLVDAGTVTTGRIGNRESLRITYTPDPDGSKSAGEMLITVVPASGLSSLSDRELEVTVYTSAYSSTSVAFTTKVFLAEGAASASAKIQFTQPLNYGVWAFDVKEDGQNIVKPPLPFQSANNRSRNKSLSITLDGFTNDEIELRLNNAEGWMLSISSAPTDWRGYLGYEAVLIRNDSFEVASSEQLEALSNYVLAGGFLIIHDANGETPLKVDQSFFGRSDLKEKDSRWQVNKSGDSQVGFTRSHGGGTVVVCDTVPTQWYETLRGTEQYPLGDLAISSTSDQNWFWRNLVMSVGKTPIWGFVIFVTLFVIVIGPVIIRTTDKLRHRTLMLFLIPAFSLIATLLFLLFNVSRDGFRTFGRVAALHYYDVNSNRGFSWTRQSYFSGAPPREGLRFEAGTFLRPVDTGNDQYWSYGDPRDRVGAVIKQSQDGVVLVDWMISRSQQSLLVGSPLGADKFPISAQTINDEEISIKNETNEPLAIVVLKVSAERCFCALDLDAGETRKVTAEHDNQVDSKVRSLRIDLEPKAPAEVSNVPIQQYNRNWYSTKMSNADPIDNNLRKFRAAKLQDHGYWIACQQRPKHSLPFPAEVYSKEKHFLIMTGAYKW